MRGNISSPNYPQHYAHDLHCSWTITVSAGYYVYLHFEHFHLEDGGSHCPYDYVQIYDGSLASSPITTKRCAYQDSWCVYSHSNVVIIVLITDGSVSHPGFSAYYERVYQTYPNCSAVSTSKEDIFLYDHCFTFYRDGSRGQVHGGAHPSPHHEMKPFEFAFKITSITLFFSGGSPRKENLGSAPGSSSSEF